MSVVEYGSDLALVAKQSLAVEGYRQGRLSIGQVAHLLDLSIDGADGFLKARGVFPDFTPDDLARDVESLKRLLGPKAASG